MSLTKHGRLLVVTACASIIAVLTFVHEVNGGRPVRKNSSSDERLSEIFKRPKLVCFGRYAMEVPRTAEVIIGVASMSDDIEILSVEAGNIGSLVDKEIARIKNDSQTAEVTYNGKGPVNQSWQLRYFVDKYARKRGAIFFTTFIAKEGYIFKIGDAVSAGESEALVIDRQSSLSRRLSLLQTSEVPASPGFCLKNGFVADDKYARQEILGAGLDFPEFPDVTFSISSNKDAYADLHPSDFEKSKQEDLPLLARIEQAKKIQGSDYPPRTVLREGKRVVQHWHGEESLFRRDDGTHDFEWAFIGKPKDVANPSEFRVKMFTKVARNTVGAAEKASLTDDEAVALWDKLLAGLKFRVKVPGSPEGSYYFLPGEKNTSGAEP